MEQPEEYQEVQEETTTQDVPQPKQKTTFEKVNNLFKWFSVFSEWFASFGNIYKKHFDENFNQNNK